MTFTRQQLANVVRNDKRVIAAKGTEVKIASAINQMVSDFVKHGLEYQQQKLSFHAAGRAEHRYSAWDLSRYIGGYLAGVKNHKMNLKKAIASAVADHLNLMGYQGTPLNKKDASDRALRVFIFGKEAADEYYKEG